MMADKLKEKLVDFLVDAFESYGAYVQRRTGCCFSGVYHDSSLYGMAEIEVVG